MKIPDVFVQENQRTLNLTAEFVVAWSEFFDLVVQLFSLIIKNKKHASMYVSNHIFASFFSIKQYQ